MTNTPEATAETPTPEQTANELLFGIIQDWRNGATSNRSVADEIAFAITEAEARGEARGREAERKVLLEGVTAEAVREATGKWDAKQPGGAQCIAISLRRHLAARTTEETSRD